MIRYLCTVFTTKEAEYPGTAIEVVDEDEHDLFQIVVDVHGEQQVLFFAQPSHFRMPLKNVLIALREGEEKALPFPIEDDAD